MRLRTVIVLIAVLAVALVPAALAGPPAIEDFVYPNPDGTPIAGLNGGTGFAGPWGTSLPFAGAYRLAPGLTFPGLTTAGKSAYANYSSAAWAYNNRVTDFTYGLPGSTFWAQYLIRPSSDFGQWGAMVVGTTYLSPGSVQVGLLNTGGGAFRALFIQPGAGPTVYTVPFNYQPNQTYLIQAKFVVDGTGNAVDVQAWVWQNNLGPAATVSANGLTWNPGGSVLLQLYSTGGYSYDMFRIGDNPDNPVPEAGTMVALGSFLSMGGLYLRRRFARS